MKKRFQVDAKSLGLILAVVYFASYFTRINFNALMVEIVASEGVTKTSLSPVTTGLFITYGIGQLVSGWLGDRIAPQRLILGGLLLSALMNVLLPLCPISAMTPLWCVNGFAQAMIWPPIVRILATYLKDADYSRGTISVNRGGSLGTIAVYLLAPICIALMGWRSMFFLSAACAVIVSVIFYLLYRKMPPAPQSTSAQKDGNGKSAVKSRLPQGTVLVLGMIMAAIVLQGTLKDGVTAWMPSYISETYNLGSKISILTGVLLPIFSIICYDLTLWLYNRFFKDELSCAAVIFCVALLVSGLLALLADFSAVLSVALSTLLTGCMHSINLLLVCILPRRFAKTGRVSTISGVLNFCTYIGSAVSIYGIAALAENFGWAASIMSWAAVSLLGMLVCGIISRRWNRYYQEI